MNKMIVIKEHSKVLFQGDSVTDWHRDRDDITSMGDSYVKTMHEYLSKFNIQVVNKGIAGNKVNNLLERYEADFKNIKPDYIFILIGVNDTWHNYPEQKSTEQFEEEYKLLIDKILNDINVPIILLEPFIIGYNEDIICMQTDLNDKIEVIKRISNKYHLEYISFKEEFDKILTKDNYLEFDYNETCFVTIKVGSNGYAYFDNISTEKPTHTNAYYETTVSYKSWRDGYVISTPTRYYMNEDKSLDAERYLNDNIDNAYVKVRVKNGKMVIVGVYVNNMLIDTID